MLDAVRRHRLYKDKYKDFADYCNNALGRAHFYCHKIIQATKVCLDLIKANFPTLPTSVAPALPLLKYAKVDSGGNCDLSEKWSQVIKSIRDHQITAVKIQETLDENPEDRAKLLRINGKAYKLLQQKAVAAGMSVSKYLEQLITYGEPPESEPPDDESEKTELTPDEEEICSEAEAFCVTAKSFAGKSFSKKTNRQPRRQSHKAGTQPDSS